MSPPVDKYQLAARFGHGLEAFSVERGAPFAALAKEQGFAPGCFDELDAKVSLDRFARLLERLAAETEDPTFGLTFGRRYLLGGTGSLGYGVKHAPRLRDMLRFLARYSSINFDLASIGVESVEDGARLRWSYPPLVVRSGQLVDFVAVVVMRHLRAALGERWRPMALRLEREAPDDAAAYRAVLGAHVSFGGRATEFTFAGPDLDMQNPNADPVLFAMMRRRCEELLAQQKRPLGLVDRVQEEALEMFGAEAVTAEAIAARIGVSVRSLQRKLADEGVTFQDVVDGARRDLSTRLLSDTRMPLQEISRRLGFSAPSSYTRSALRWYGRPPSEWRDS